MKKSLLTVLVLSLGMVFCSPNQSSSPAAPSNSESGIGGQSPEPVAKVGGEELSGTELAEMIRPRLAKLDSEVYKIKRQAVSEWVNNQLLANEAKKKGVALPKLLEDTTASVEVSDAEAKEFYEQNKSRINQDFDKAKPRIMAQLTGKKRQEAVQSLLAKLQKGSDVEIYLEQPRADVSVDDDPGQGKKGAPITLIEFSDFQCPFCKRTRETISEVLSTYGDKVHYVFRDFPLNFHKDAMLAHQAANCASEQDKYWEYSKGLWERQHELQRDKLVELAKSLKLDEGKFTQCLDSGKYEDEINKDTEDGKRAGVSGTPAYFINGRFLGGAQPFEEFKAIIDEELAKK